MNLHLLTKLELLRTFAPMPWYMEQDNDKGIEVRDARGQIVFFEDYGGIPDEAPSHIAEDIIARARALGRFLVAFSENPLP